MNVEEGSEELFMEKGGEPQGRGYGKDWDTT